jgi:hypothetical protein
MRFILKLRHWQIFSLAIGLPILADIFGKFQGRQTGAIAVIIGMMTASTLFGWIWSIANELHKKLPIGNNFKLWRFKTSLLFALALLVFLFWADENEVFMDSDTFLFLSLPGIAIYLALMIHSVLFAAKILRSVELRRVAKMEEYAGDAFLIWMAPLGVWLIQPRLNNLENCHTIEKWELGTTADTKFTRYHVTSNIFNLVQKESVTYNIDNTSFLINLSTCFSEKSRTFGGTFDAKRLDVWRLRRFSPFDVNITLMKGTMTSADGTTELNLTFSLYWICKITIPSMILFFFIFQYLAIQSDQFEWKYLVIMTLMEIVTILLHGLFYRYQFKYDINKYKKILNDVVERSNV